MVPVLDVFARGAHQGACVDVKCQISFVWSQVLIENMEATGTTTGDDM